MAHSKRLSLLVDPQVADGVQISAAGALRGYKDTRVPMLINLFAYWVIGFPAAYVAAKVLKLEPQMIWVAFVLALSVSAVLLSARLRIVSRRQFSEFQEAV